MAISRSLARTRGVRDVREAVDVVAVDVGEDDGRDVGGGDAGGLELVVELVLAARPGTRRTSRRGRRGSRRRRRGSGPRGARSATRGSAAARPSGPCAGSSRGVGGPVPSPRCILSWMRTRPVVRGGWRWVRTASVVTVHRQATPSGAARQRARSPRLLRAVLQLLAHDAALVVGDLQALFEQRDRLGGAAGEAQRPAVVVEREGVVEAARVARGAELLDGARSSGSAPCGLSGQHRVARVVDGRGGAAVVSGRRGVAWSAASPARALRRGGRRRRATASRRRACWRRRRCRCGLRAHAPAARSVARGHRLLPSSLISAAPAPTTRQTAVSPASRNAR